MTVGVGSATQKSALPRKDGGEHPMHENILRFPHFDKGEKRHAQKQ